MSCEVFQPSVSFTLCPVGKQPPLCISNGVPHCRLFVCHEPQGYHARTQVQQDPRIIMKGMLSPAGAYYEHCDQVPSQHNPAHMFTCSVGVHDLVCRPSGPQNMDSALRIDCLLFWITFSSRFSYFEEDLCICASGGICGNLFEIRKS